MMSHGPAKPATTALACLAALLLLPVPSGLAAPPPPTTPAETFSESVDVSVVNVEVYVTDKDGKRVQGLKKEDFELSEDGKPVPISNFYAVDASAGIEPGAPGNAGAPAPATPATAATAAPAASQQLYLALFVDEQSLTVQARNRMIPALKGFISGHLRPGDRVLVASYNGYVKVRQAPTANPAVLEAALASLAKGSAKGTERAIDRRRVLDDIAQGATAPRYAEADASRTYGAVRALAQADYDEIRATTKALGQFVGSLAGLPGRKAVLLVSGGMSQRPAEGLYEAWHAKYARYAFQVGASRFDAFRQETQRLFSELAEGANANRVTFYTLTLPEDISGLTADSSGNYLLPPGVAATEEINQTQPLQTLAGATGGLAAVDKTGAFLDSLRADLDSYYSLGYAPSHREDGQTHKLAVKVKDRSLTVRVREGYRARTGVQATSSRTLTALLLGEEGNPLGVSLAIEGERPHGKKEYEVSLLVKLPLGKVALLPKDGAHEGRLRVFVGARDEEGRLSDINEIAVPLRIPDDKLAAATGQAVGTRVTLLLRPGRHTLAVGVRDELANADSTVTGIYTAGRLTKAGAAGGGP